jgi:hypothetical protein
MVKTASVNQDHTDQTASNALLKNIGTNKLRPASVTHHSFGAENIASAHHQRPSSMERTAHAQLELSALNAFHAHHQDHGTTI